MKKTKLTRHMVFLLVFAVLFTATLPMERIQAASIKKQYEFYVYPKAPNSEKQWEEIPISTGGMIPQDIKSSDEKVFTAKKGSGDYKGSIIVYPAKVKKVSKATLSFQYNGKELSTEITIRPWENPVKSFKLGTKDITKYFDKSGVYILGKQKKSLTGKMKIQLKSDWTIKRIKCRDKNGFKTVKNGAKILLDPKIKDAPGTKDPIGTVGSAICVKLKNIKTNEKVVLEYWYSSLYKTENLYFNSEDIYY